MYKCIIGWTHSLELKLSEMPLFIVLMFECTRPGCHRKLRAHVQESRIEAQVEGGCECGGHLEHIVCPATHTITVFKHGVRFVHNGYHSHGRPTHLLHINSRQHCRFQELVEQNPKSGPLQLLVGVPTLHGPGPSAKDISPIFLNKDWICWLQRASNDQERNYTPMSSSKKSKDFSARHSALPMLGLHKPSAVQYRKPQR